MSWQEWKGSRVGFPAQELVKMQANPRRPTLPLKAVLYRTGGEKRKEGRKHSSAKQCWRLGGHMIGD